LGLLVVFVHQPININDETSTFAANVGWYLFVPWHVYTIKCLPRTEMLVGEEPLDTAQRVMRATAEALRQQATPFLYRDKIAFTRYKVQQIRSRGNR
jgi:ancient ubiquitous protein 1